MPVAAPTEAYAKMIAYGEKKTQLRSDQLALQSFLAGFWVAVYGHALTVFASQFYMEGSELRNGIAKAAYGFLFPGAFVAVIYTGTELFTGNTVTMIMLVFHKGRKALRHLVRVWLFSLVGNCIGAVFGAFFFSYLSKEFTSGLTREYLFHMAASKTSRDFIPNVILGVGCNALVCLATWCVVCSDDGAGKILAIFYSIAVFAVGGYEHIIANMYTLTAAAMCGYDGHTFGEILWRNWLPVLIGNLLAGTLFTGAMWWYALHPEYSDLAPYTDMELAHELSHRYAGTAYGAHAVPDDALRWKRGETAGLRSALLVPPHLVPQQPPSPTPSTLGIPSAVLPVMPNAGGGQATETEEAQTPAGP